jgi:L-cysteine/cystine lyase
MPEDHWIDLVRRELPVLKRCIYLNAGTAGPTPLCSHHAHQRELEAELDRGRGNLSDFSEIWRHREQTRTALAGILGAETDTIAFTHSTSEGINLVLNGLDWSAGDEVVTTTLEHDAVAVPLGILARRHGVKVHFADVGCGERACEAVSSFFSRRTRLVVISHVAYSTGALLPVARIGELAHQHGASLCVDGAQACGALPIDVRELGADAYTLSGQKWLLGPEGTGAIYLSPTLQERLVPPATSYFSAREHDFRGNVALHDNARRFEYGMIHRPSLASLHASLQWLQREVGIERAWQRSLELTGHCRERLQAVRGVKLLTPREQQSSLLSFALPALSPSQIAQTARALAEKQILCRSIDHPPHALRISIGFFNTADELDRFAAEIEDLSSISGRSSASEEG